MGKQLELRISTKTIKWFFVLIWFFEFSYFEDINIIDNLFTIAKVAVMLMLLVAGIFQEKYKQSMFFVVMAVAYAEYLLVIVVIKYCYFNNSIHTSAPFII